MRAAPVEITDLLWDFGAAGERLPVRRGDVAEILRGQHRAARLVEGMPASAGVLDARAVDELGLRVHRELARLGEELQLAQRVAALVREIATASVFTGERIRLVDVGCGLGHVLRTIAARRMLPPTIELVGADLNPVLVTEAERLARAERVEVRFVAADGFEPGVVIAGDVPTIVISTGVLHHLGVDDLPAFFGAQAALGVVAFAHWDIARSAWSTLGAWVFHRARMREPVSRHDGVLSARRAHPAAVLLAAARGAEGYEVAVREGSRWHPAALDVLRPITGLRR